MAKMAAKAAAMRVDISQTMAVADKLFSPESAIDVASTLQRLGATSSALLDPLKLMDLAQNNVPELQNQLSELSKTFTTFDKKTNTFQIMPEARKQLKEVADALGIDRVEFEKMAIESAKIEKKMGEINFKGLENVPEDQKMMLANIAEFNKNSGRYEVTYKDADGAVTTQALNNLQKGDIDLIAQQQQFQKKDSGLQMVDLAKDQLGAANTLIAQQNSLTTLLSTQYAISNEGNEFLKNAVIGQTEILRSGFETFSLTTQKGKDNSQQLVGDIQGRVNKVVSGDISITEITALLADFSQGFETLKPIIDDAIKIATENPTKVVISEALKASDAFAAGAEKFGIEVGDFGNAVTKITILGSAITNWASEKLGITPPKEENDIAITADGMHYSLDKGDMLMAVNQRALASSIGGSVGPLLPSNEGMASNNTTSGKKELVLTLNVNANSNDPQIKNAILSAFNNDDTLRTLRDKIGVVGSDYGLTV
jgi:NACalpha-BTF3-like transcription factor